MRSDLDTDWLAPLAQAISVPLSAHEVVEDDVLGRAHRCLFGACELLVDADGVVRHPDGLTLAEVAVGRRRILIGRRADCAASEAAADLLVNVLLLQDGRDELAADLEAMYPSSLALLEEASMWGDVLPTLPTGSTEAEIAERGLAALVVAAGVRRAVYVRYRAELDSCEPLVSVSMDEGAHEVRAVRQDGDRTLPQGGLVWEAIRGDGSARLLNVPPGGSLGEPGSVESLAEQQVIVVPVRYGADAHCENLGVLLVMDRRDHLLASHGDELSSHETKLAHAVAAMLGSVLGTRRVAEMGKELEAAQTINKQIQPAEVVEVRGFDVAAHNRACGTVGGDYFDFLRMADGRTFGVVVDVSGHDLASGMLMVSARMSLRVLAPRQNRAGALFDELADVLADDLRRTERFLTAAGVALTPGRHTVDLTAAGHPDVLVLRSATGTVDHIAGDAPVLGFLAGIEHPTTQVHLGEGDLLLLYTDGLIEAENARQEMLGEERVEEILRECVGRSAREVLTRLILEVEKHRGNRAQQDDVTLLVVRAVGGSESNS